MRRPFHHLVLPVLAVLVVVLAVAVGLTGGSAGAAPDCAKHPNARVCRTPSPTPTTTSTSPSPTPTTPTPTPTGSTCITSAPSGACGPYSFAGITNSNGYNTYVLNNCWADPQCRQTVTAIDPGHWNVVSTEPLGNIAVKTYPTNQQLTNNWNGSGWGGNGFSDTPLAPLTRLTSSYAETMPRTPGTDAQIAWDIWLSNTGNNEVMVWVDNVNRGNGGATYRASYQLNGQTWSLYQYGSELIWSLGAQGQYAQQTSGTVDLLALLRWLVTNGYEPANAVIGQIDFGWEICSTGGVPETFTVSSYTLTMAA